MIAYMETKTFDATKSVLDTMICKNCKYFNGYSCELNRQTSTDNTGLHFKAVKFDDSCIDWEKGESKQTPEHSIADIPEYLRTEIKIPHHGKLTSNFCKEVGQEMKDHKVIFYRPDGRDIVEINKIHDMKGKLESIGFIEVTPNRMITLIERYITPVSTVQKKDGSFVTKHKSINTNLAAVLLEAAQFHEDIPKIKRIFTVPIPILYEYKLTFPKPGYDERFNSWMPYNAPSIERTDMPLAEAKSIIYNLFKEFCFKNKQDYTHAVAALLTPFLRGLFKSFSCRSPVFFYLANRERAGKDYCAGITGIIYEGFALEEPPICSSEKSLGHNDELRKKLLSAFMSGRKRLHFSNNRGYIDNAVFEGVITADKYSDRVLGKNEVLTFDNEVDFSLSGNVGVGFTADLANRARMIRLFLDIEDANKRKFENPDLHLYVKDNRGIILSALYALVRHWIDSGMKPGSVSFSSFPEWAKICGGIMESAGYGSPCDADAENFSIGGDEETQDMKALFELAYERFPEEFITKNMVKAIAKENENLFPFLDFEKRPDQTKFGNLLKKFTGRVLSDIQLRVKDNNARSDRQEMIFSKSKAELNKGLIYETKQMQL